MILVGTRATLDVTLYRDGTPTDPDVGETATCTITDEAGETVLTGNATRVGSDSGRLTFAWTAATNTVPRRVTVTWGNIVFSSEPAITIETSEEAVGALLFTEAEARAYDDATLANTSTYPDADILGARDRIQESFSEIVGVSLGGRGRREVLDGEGSRYARVSRWPLRDVQAIATRARGSQAWTAFTADELADVLDFRGGTIERETLGTFPSGARNVAVTYEHGLDPIPADLRLAGLQVLRASLVPSNIPDRALFSTTELGQFRLAVADSMREHWYGLPQVDAVLQRYRAKYRVPGVG